jgi:HSP20 family protein
MAPATKEAERKAVATPRPNMEILPRANDFEQWFNRLAGDFWRRPFPSLLRPERWWPLEGGMAGRIPAVDVYEDKDDLVIQAEIPGLAKEDISVQVSDATLTLKGEKKREAAINEDEYYCHERAFGAFSRMVELPCEVKSEQVKASVKNGLLEVRLPKTEEAKKRAITVKIE